MNTSQLEFRVLTGLQSGARIRLPDGDYSLGNSIDCDIVVQGHDIEPLHLRVRVDGKQFILTPIASHCGTTDQIISSESALEANQFFSAGKCWFQIAEADTPWPDTEVIAELSDKVRTSQADNLPIEEEAVESDHLKKSTLDDTPSANQPMTSDPDEYSTSADVEDTGSLSKDSYDEVGTRSIYESAEDDIDGTDATESASASGRSVSDEEAPESATDKDRKRIGVMSISMLAAVFLGGVAIAVVTPGAATTATEQTTASSDKSGLNAATNCANQVIERYNLSKRFDITQDEKNRLVAKGYTTTASELAVLQKSMIQLCPAVQLTAAADETLAHQVSISLARIGKSWTLHSLKNGRAVVRRNGLSSYSAEEMKADLMKEVDGLASAEEATIDLGALKRQVDGLLEQFSLTSQISVMVKGNRVHAVGHPDADETRRWSSLTAQLQQQHGVDLPLVAEFDAQRSTLPFRIHQVVGGSMPFIVIDDGTRLFEGGSSQGVHLVSIKENQLLFRGQHPIEITW